MTKSIRQTYQKKWLTILKQYELVRHKRSKHFKKVKELCEAYGINAKDLGKYYGRWVRSNKNPESLVPKKRGPKPGSRKILSKEEERIIVKIQRKFNTGHRNIFNLLMARPRLRIYPSAITIYRTLKNYPRPKKKEAIKRYEKQIPGELMHSDNHNLPKGTLIEKKRYTKIFGMIDDCTRMCYVELLRSFDAPEVSRAFTRAMKWFDCHGIETERVMTDNGPEYTSPPNKKSSKQHPFALMAEVFSVKHLRTKPYRPQTNGKIERFWRTFDEEYVMNNTFQTVRDLEVEIDKYMYDYNYVRKHSAIDYNTPFEKLQKVTELLK